MAQIFISHSGSDEKIRNFFANIFASSNVRAVFKEIEGFSTESDSDEIEKDIQNSSAVFILLGENVQNLAHTRDWVVWESGVAKTLDRDIWVFEPLTFYGKINIAIPKVSHYLPYIENSEFMTYFRSIINSYDRTEVLPSVIIGGVIGALGGLLIETMVFDKKLGLGTFLGGVIGSTLGLLYSDKSQKKPMGLTIKCVKCTNTYKIHTRIEGIRCPICNTILKVKWPDIETDLIRTVHISETILKKLNPIQTEFDRLKILLMRLLTSRAGSSLNFTLRIQKLHNWQEYFGLACEYKKPIDDTNHYFLDGEYYIIPNSATLRKIDNRGYETELITKNDIPEEITERTIQNLEEKIEPFLNDIKNYIMKEHGINLN